MIPNLFTWVQNMAEKSYEYMPKHSKSIESEIAQNLYNLILEHFLSPRQQTEWNQQKIDVSKIPYDFVEENFLGSYLHFW